MDLLKLQSVLCSWIHDHGRTVFWANFWWTFCRFCWAKFQESIFEEKQPKKNYTCKMVIHLKIVRKQKMLYRKLVQTIFNANPQFRFIYAWECFQNVKAHVCIDALENYITHRTITQFLERIKTALLNYYTDVINRAMRSINKHVHPLINAKRKRI